MRFPNARRDAQVSAAAMCRAFFKLVPEGERPSAETSHPRHRWVGKVPVNAQKDPEGPICAELDVFEKPKNSEDKK